MQLSEAAEAKIENEALKALLRSADADAILTAEEADLNIYFESTPREDDRDLPAPASLEERRAQRQAWFEVLKADNEAHYERVVSVLESLGIESQPEEFHKNWMLNAIQYKPSALRADQLVALIEQDSVTSVEATHYIQFDHGMQEEDAQPVFTVEEIREVQSHLSEKYSGRLSAFSVATAIGFRETDEGRSAMLILMPQAKRPLQGAFIETLESEARRFAQEKFGKDLSADDLVVQPTGPARALAR